MKMTQEELARLVYEHVCGETSEALRPELAGLEIADAYADGAVCDLLYWDFWHARERVCAKLGHIRDSDLDELADVLIDIGKEISLRMFCYGMEAQRLGLLEENDQ